MQNSARCATGMLQQVRLLSVSDGADPACSTLEEAQNVRESTIYDAAQMPSTQGEGTHARQIQPSIQQVDTFGLSPEGASGQIDATFDLVQQQSMPRLLHSPFFHNKSFNSRGAQSDSHREEGNEEQDVTLENGQLPSMPVKTFSCTNMLANNAGTTKKIERQMRHSLKQLPRKAFRHNTAKQFSFFSLEALKQNTSLGCGNMPKLKANMKSTLPKMTYLPTGGGSASAMTLGAPPDQASLLTEGERSPVDKRKITSGHSAANMPQYETFGSNQKKKSHNKKLYDSAPKKQPKANFDLAVNQFVAAVHTQRNFLTLGSDSGSLMCKAPLQQGRSRQSGASNGLMGGVSQPYNTRLRATGGSLDGAKEESRKIFHTMDNASEFEQACVQAANYIDLLQKSTKEMCKKSKPGAGGNSSRSESQKHRSGKQPFTTKAKMQNYFHQNSAQLKIPRSPHDYFLQRNNVTSRSVNRSNSRLDTHSRSSATLPLVMRHCYANNEAKRRLVEENQTAWHENQSLIQRHNGASSSQCSRPHANLISPDQSPTAFENGMGRRWYHEKKRSLDMSVKQISLAPHTGSPASNTAGALFQPPNTIQHIQESQDEENQVRQGTVTQQKKRAVNVKQRQKRVGNTLLSPKLGESTRFQAFSPLGQKPKRYFGSLMPNKKVPPQKKTAQYWPLQKSNAVPRTIFNSNIKLRNSQTKQTLTSSKPAQLNIFRPTSERPSLLSRKGAQLVPSFTAQKKNNAMLTLHTTQSQTPLKSSLIPVVAQKAVSTVITSTSPAKINNVANQEDSEQAYPPVKTLFISINGVASNVTSLGKGKLSNSSTLMMKQSSAMLRSTATLRSTMASQQVLQSGSRPSASGGKKAPAFTHLKARPSKMAHQKQVESSQRGSTTGTKAQKNAQSSSAIAISGGLSIFTPSKFEVGTSSRYQSTGGSSRYVKLAPGFSSAKQINVLSTQSKSRRHCRFSKDQNQSEKEGVIEEVGNDSDIDDQKKPKEQGLCPQYLHLETIESVEGMHVLPTYTLGISQATHRASNTSTKFVQEVVNQQSQHYHSNQTINGSQYKFPAAADSPSEKEGPSKANLIAPPIISQATFNTRKKFDGLLIENNSPSYNEQLEAKENISLRQQLTSEQRLVDSNTSEELENGHDQADHECKHRRSVTSMTCKFLPIQPCESPEPGVSVSPEENGGGITACCYPLICQSQQLQPATVDYVPESSKTLQQNGASKLTKQKSWVDQRNKLFWKGSSTTTIADLAKADILPNSLRGSVHNLSLAKTESIAFQPSNPLILLRRLQAKQNYVWFATYDEDILHDTFMRKISYCKDQCLPWEFVPWRLFDVQLFLFNESQLCLRREPGQETLCKIYLVQIDQVKDIVRYKNHINDRKALHRQGLLSNTDKILMCEELREKYEVTTLQREGESNHSASRSSSKDEIMDDWRTMSVSITDERQDKKNQICKGFNFAVTMENQKEFDDLQDEENAPMLDLIYHEQTAMGLPIVIATNRDQSKLDNTIPATPSYFKHLKSLKPDLSLIIMLLQGLMQSFPDQTAEQLMFSYIELIPGVQGKLSDEEITIVLQKSVEGVSISSWSDQPHAKLLTAQQTSKMFELMQNNQVDPNDFQSGYQSLSLFNEQNYRGAPAGEDRDVVFLGAENSDLLEPPQLYVHDLSENNQMIIDQFNQDFQLQQQLILGEHLKQGLPGVYSSDTSQVDNFIFQNVNNRLSNQASQDGLYNITPQRDDHPWIGSRHQQTMQHTCGTHGMASRSGSSVAIQKQPDPHSEKTSYQGACRILNLQQPLFQGAQWNNNSGFDDQSGRDESGPPGIKRGSSQGMLSYNTSPPFKPLRPLNSARKPAFFSGKNSSQLVPAENFARNRMVLAASTVIKHQQYCSNIPSTNRSNVMTQHQPGYEIAIDDFDMNVESIRPVQLDNGSAYQASNSLFIQSGRSRNPKTANASSKKESLKNHSHLQNLSYHKQMPDPNNRFELSQESSNRKQAQQEEFEEFIVPGGGMTDDKGQPQMSTSRENTPEEGRSQPICELIDQVSDIIAANTGAVLQTSPSKERVLEEDTNLIRPINSLKKPPHNRKYRFPPLSGSKRLKLAGGKTGYDAGQGKTNESPFLERRTKI